MPSIFRFTCALDPLYGGVPQGISLISKETANFELKTTIVSCGNSRGARMRSRSVIEDLSRNNIRVLRSGAIFTNPYGLGGSVKLIFNLMRNEKADLVVIHQVWSFSTLLGYLYSRAFSIKFVVMPHGSLSDYHMIKNRKLKNFAFVLFIRKVIKDAANIVLTSSFEMNELDVHLKSKAVVIPYAISGHVVKALPRIKNQILFAGRVTPKKNLHMIIESLPILKDWNQGIKLVIAGDGLRSDINELENLIRKLGLEKDVRFLGWLGRSELNSVMSQSQVFVLPSEYENFAHSVMESLAYGTPAVVSERVALSGIIHKYSSGIVIKENSPTEIANGVILALQNFKQFSVNSKRAASIEFTWNKVALAWRNLIEN